MVYIEKILKDYIKTHFDEPEHYIDERHKVFLKNRYPPKREDFGDADVLTMTTFLVTFAQEFQFYGICGHDPKGFLEHFNTSVRHRVAHSISNGTNGRWSDSHLLIAVNVASDLCILLGELLMPDGKSPDTSLSQISNFIYFKGGDYQPMNALNERLKRQIFEKKTGTELEQITDLLVRMHDELQPTEEDFGRLSTMAVKKDSTLFAIWESLGKNKNDLTKFSILCNAVLKTVRLKSLDGIR